MKIEYGEQPTWSERAGAIKCLLTYLKTRQPLFFDWLIKPVWFVNMLGKNLIKLFLILKGKLFLTIHPLPKINLTFFFNIFLWAHVPKPSLSKTSLSSQKFPFKKIAQTFYMGSRSQIVDKLAIICLCSVPRNLRVNNTLLQ